MKFFVVLAIVAATSAVKVTSPEYSVNIVHHPQGGHSVYNPFVKPGFQEFPSNGPGSSYFG